MKSFHPEINRIFKPIQKQQILAMILFLVSSGFKLVLLIEVQKMIDSISANDLNVTMGYLRNSAVMIALFFGINCVFQFLFRHLEYTSNYLLVKSLFGMALEKEYAFHETYGPSVVLSMVKDDSRFISDWKSIGIIVVGGNIAILAMVFVIMLRYNVFITLFAFLIVFLCFAITHYISEIIGKKTYDLQVCNSEVNQKVIDYLNGIKDIKQYKKERFFRGRFSEFIDATAYLHSRGISRYYSVFTSIYAVLTTALPVLVILLGVLLIISGQFTIGQLIAIYGLVGNLQEPILVIPDYFNKRRQALAVQEKLMPILEKDAAGYEVSQLGELKDLAFHSDSYVFGDGKKILEKVSFEMKKGEHAIVKGESGKGKSSLLNIISRFHGIKGQRVSMEYNGIPVETIQPHAYYEHVLQAPQTPYIFRDTVQNNITMGDDFSEEELNEVLETACLEEFVAAKGLSYLLEQNGENVSGGQRQRIGLARALLRKPDLLMLDEPTSALNPELVWEITRRIAGYCEKYGIGLMVISHGDSFEKWYEERGERKWVEV